MAAERMGGTLVVSPRQASRLRTGFTGSLAEAARLAPTVTHDPGGR